MESNVENRAESRIPASTSVMISVVSGIMTGCIVGCAGLFLYHRNVVTHGVAEVVVPWSTLTEQIASIRVEKNAPLGANMVLDQFSFKPTVGPSLKITGTSKFSAHLLGSLEENFEVSFIPVIKERKIYAAAIEVNLIDEDKSNSTLKSTIESMLPTVIGAWTSNHSIWQLPEHVVVNESGFARVVGSKPGLRLIMQDDSN